MQRSGSTATNDVPVTPAKGAKKEVIAFSILVTHIKRIGFFRTVIGGGLMYLSIIEFCFIHLAPITILYQWMLAPFFAVKKFRMRDYIVIDRHRIEGMTLFDKLNCVFCGYANGSTKLWNDQLDEISRADLGSGNIISKLIAFLFSLCIACFLVFNFIFSKILFTIISLFHAYHRVSVGEIRKSLKEENYAGSHGFILRGLLKFAKTYAKTLMLNLEQIESSWCPLKHVETQTTVFPDHHKNFFARDDYKGALSALGRDGSVSPKKPKY